MSARRAARWRWGEPLEPLRRILARGGVLAVPTESSYGLAVDPRSATGVESVRRLKERGLAKPLPVVASGREQLEALGCRMDDPVLERLAREWPAALSLIVPLRRPLPAAAGTGSLAVRIPAHPRLVDLLSRLGHALTATSANRAGRPPLLAPGELDGLLAGADAVVVDDGRLPGGPPSTLVAFGAEGPAVLRQGRYPMARLRRLVPDLRISGGFSAAVVEMSADERGD